MSLKEPDSMAELVYWTKRNIGDGRAKVWVPREMCPKCRKTLMGKPTDKKGKVQIRAKTYVCKECGNTIEKQEYEDSLTANIIYTCPSCKADGEIQIPFKRKKVEGTDSLVFNCQKCSSKIVITKKMKDI